MMPYTFLRDPGVFQAIWECPEYVALHYALVLGNNHGPTLANGYEVLYIVQVSNKEQAIKATR